MRRFLRWLRPARRGPQPRLVTTGAYRTAAYPPLRPWQVRGRHFTITRRGLDPAEVAAFLDRVAHDLDSLYARLAVSDDENRRIKDALRRWQSSQAPSMRDLARR